MHYLFNQLVYIISYLIWPFLIFLIFRVILTKQKISRIISITLILISIIIIYSFNIEPKSYVYRTVNLNNNPSESIKIIVLADLHQGIFKNGIKLEKISQIVNQQNPDIVILPGDIVYEIDQDKIISALSPLKKINAPIYAVSGNHDVGYPGTNLREPLENAFKKLGIHFIDNKITYLSIKNQQYTIIGFSELWERKTDFSLIKNLTDAEKVIAIGHNPDMAYYMPNNHNIDLMISGHTHGGQLRIPFIYKYFIPTEHNFEYGLYNVNNMKIYVSAGIGLSGLPYRFLCPPEITEINF